MPISAQDARAAPGREANISTLPWKAWVRGRVAQHLCEKAAHIATIQLVLSSLHARGRADAAPIDVSIDLNSKRKAAKASEDLPIGAVALPPCVPKSSSVLDKSTHPRRVPIQVIEKSAVADGKPDVRVGTKGKLEPKRNIYYVNPEYKSPEESKEELDDAVRPQVRAWEFKGDETMHPFWAVERLTEGERRKALKGAFNFKCEDKEFVAVSVGALSGDSIASACYCHRRYHDERSRGQEGGGVVFRKRNQEGAEAEGRVVENRRDQGQ